MTEEEFEQICEQLRELNPHYNTAYEDGHVDAVCNCDGTGCMFCVGGLSACSICGGLEGSLPTFCPGRAMTADETDQVYGGILDYRRGNTHLRPHLRSASRGRELPCCGTPARYIPPEHRIVVNSRLATCGWVNAPSVHSPQLWRQVRNDADRRGESSP